MGLTKQYLRYAPCAVFGIVGSQKTNIIFLEIKGLTGRYCAVGACENVLIWDLRTSEQFKVLHGDKHEVTVIARSPDKRHLAVGYNDGTVRVFNLSSGEVTVTFNGHKSTVTALKFDNQGVRLVSGAKDTDVILWDLVSEAGLYRLKGHKGVVTQAQFVTDHNILITSSKDCFVKFWDLDTQHCFKTLVGHRSEVNDFMLVKKGRQLISGSADSELRVWNIIYKDQSDEMVSPAKKARTGPGEGEEEHDNDEHLLDCVRMGSVMRHSRDRVVSMVTDPDNKLLICHGNDHSLEIFKILTDDELRKQLNKRQKKAKRKLREAGEENPQVDVELNLDDRLPKLNSLKMSGKIRSVDVHIDSGLAKIAALLTNNTIEMCSVDTGHKNCEPVTSSKHSQGGHRTDVRALCFSSDSTAIMSTSGDMVKVWNRSSLQPVRTMKCGYGLCCMFAPGDRHVIVGTKTGKLELFDLSSGSLLEETDAHTGPLWAMAMAPDKRGIVSGSADHEVKFWNFEFVTGSDDAASSSKRLSLQHTRTLTMDEDVLCVKYSPDQRLLAIALLDNTVKVFFADTLKFFLSLYGHKLPVLCLDISTDSSLIITGSADRNVKIWGLDFGDCHKSIFAHDDSIMCLQFVPRTHFFFSGGKDRKIKEWDADNFEHIQTLEGHHGEVWCLATSPSGNYLVTGSHDKSIRLWEKTQEPLILEEEREMEREKEFEESVKQSDEPVVTGETNKEVAMAGKKTMETIKAAERIMEAVEVYKEEQAKLDQHQLDCESTGKQLPLPALSPLLLAYNVTSPDKYVLEILRKVKSSELEESLLVLPFPCVIDLLKLLNLFLENGWEVELSCRCLFFLLRVHQGQITSNQVLLPVLEKLRCSSVQRTEEMRDCIGFNLAGLCFLQQHIEQAQEVQFFTDATDKLREKRRKEKPVLTVHT